MRIMRLPVRRSRPLIRRSNLTYAPPSTVAASKTEIASSESVRARATTAVEYGSGLERTERRRAQGHCPPPDARTRARAFNAPDASPPNTRVTGGFCPIVLFAAFPPNDPGRVRTRETRMERLIGTPSRHPRSALQISAYYAAPDPRPNKVPPQGQVGRRLTTPQLLRRIRHHAIRACDLRTSTRRLAGQLAGARVIITKLSGWDGSRPCRTEASSRSALHAAIDPYSNIYACTLCLSLEL
jgi:hypothetical protein